MKIFRLIYNEFVKQFKKPSIKIIYALILISAIVIPMVLGNMEAKSVFEFSEESLKSNILMYEEEIKSLENDGTQKAKMRKAYAEIDKIYNEILLENKISYDDWRREEAEYYQDAAYKVANIGFVLDGLRSDIVLQNVSRQDPLEVEKYYKLNKTKKKEIEAELIAKRDELLDIIKSKDYKRHTKLEIERKETHIALEKKEIEAYEKLKAKNPTTKAKKEELKKLEERKNIAVETIPNLEQDLAIMKFRDENNIDYNLSNWRNKAIKEIESILADYRMKMLDEQKYNLDYDQSLNKSYEDYVKGYKKANQIREERMKELWYSLENDIPHLGAVKDARSVIDSTYEIYVVLGVVMSIIIGGSIVANEYSTGSIRLLLIRPVSRWKVLLAKLISVLLIGFSIVILGTTILSITSGYVLGFDTLEVPVLQTINNTIVETPYFEYMIPKLIASTSSLIFITSVVFMISTLARNTALAVAIGMLLYIGAAPLTQALVSLKQTWLLDTLIPYINSSYFKLLPDFTKTLSESGLSLNYTLGAYQLLILSAVLLIITFVVFTKKDIKN